MKTREYTNKMGHTCIELHKPGNIKISTQFKITISTVKAVIKSNLVPHTLRQKVKEPNISPSVRMSFFGIEFCQMRQK